MLEIIYFHRLKFRNVELSTSLSLIKHWSDESIRDRIKKEKMSKAFGCGILETDMCPISLKLNFQDGQHILGNVGVRVGNVGSVENDGRTIENVGASDFQIPLGCTQTTIQFQLPSNSMTDEEIHSVSIDPVYEQFLFVKRDMNIVSSLDNEKIKGLIFSGRKTVEDIISSGFPMSQSDLFFMDSRVHAIIDEISELAIWVTKITQVLDEISASDHNKTNQDDTRREEINGRVPVIGFENVLVNGKFKSSVVLSWETDDKLVLVSHFLKSNYKDMKVLDPFILEIVDYCIINDSCLAPNELLVFFHEKYSIQREEFYTLGDPSKIMFTSIVDCWALMLNENQKFSKNGSQHLYFGASITRTIIEYVRSNGNSQLMDSVYLGLDKWMKISCNGFDLAKVELIFLPCLWDNHYCLFVVNLSKRKAQFIDNLSYGMENHDFLNKLSDALAPIRRVLRSQIDATLLLSDLNEARAIVIDKVATFKSNRHHLSKEVEERRKQGNEGKKNNKKVTQDNKKKGKGKA